MFLFPFHSQSTFSPDSEFTVDSFFLSALEKCTTSSRLCVSEKNPPLCPLFYSYRQSAVSLCFQDFFVVISFQKFNYYLRQISSIYLIWDLPGFRNVSSFAKFGKFLLLVLQIFFQLHIFSSLSRI